MLGGGRPHWPTTCAADRLNANNNNVDQSIGGTRAEQTAEIGLYLAALFATCCETPSRSRKGTMAEAGQHLLR